MADVRGHDASAFVEIYDRHSAALLSFCRHMLGSREDAEDALQQVFVSAHEAMLRSEAVLTLRPWLFTIARNRCLSMLRQRRDQVPLEDSTRLPNGDGLVADVENRADLREILGDLQGLPEQQRAALVLSELDAHSHEEIAQVLDVPPQKVKALVFQAREGLAAQRQARLTPCVEIRERLATLRGAGLRKANLRRHLNTCDGCRSFQADVKRQRAAMALLLPVVPSVGLKSTVLSAAAANGAVIGAGGSVAGGGLFVAGQGITAKLLITAAVVGGAGGGGYIAVHHARRPAPVPARASGSAPVPAARPAAAGAAHPASLPAGSPATGSSVAAAHRRATAGHGRSSAPGQAKVHQKVHKAKHINERSSRATVGGSTKRGAAARLPKASTKTSPALPPAALAPHPASSATPHVPHVSKPRIAKIHGRGA